MWTDKWYSGHPDDMDKPHVVTLVFVSAPSLNFFFFTVTSTVAKKMIFRLHCLRRMRRCASKFWWLPKVTAREEKREADD